MASIRSGVQRLTLYILFFGLTLKAAVLALLCQRANALARRRRALQGLSRQRQQAVEDAHRRRQTQAFVLQLISKTHTVRVLDAEPCKGGRLLLVLDAPTLPRLTPAHLVAGTRYADSLTHVTMQVSRWTS